MATRKSLFILVIIGLAGCASLSSLIGPSQDFVSAVSALAQAESDYFDEIQAASDAAYQFQAAETYVAHNGSFENYVTESRKHNDFSKAKKLRMAVMSQLQNYAQQIAAITSGASATWISDSVKTDTTNVGSLIKDLGNKNTSSFFTANAGLIQTAVTDLGEAIINNESATELQTLAKEAKGPIARIASMIKEDNANIESDNFAPGLVADQKTAAQNILHVIYDDKTVNTFERFSALQMATNWKPSLITKGQAIQNAIGKIKTANDALAMKQNSSLGALAQEAYSFATQALQTPSPAAK